jgi:hypothetical protein
METVQTDMNINKVTVNEGGASSMDNNKNTNKSSKVSAPNEPPCTVTEVNKPNMKLFAKAFTNLYQHVKVHQSELLD